MNYNYQINGNNFGNFQSVFHKKSERINWKKLAAVDIDKVVQNNDIGILRENIKHIAFCDLDAEMELRGGDMTLIKMFKMAQLMIDYLLSSQEHLASVAAEADERCAALLEETENAKRKVQDNEAYINELKREGHRRKKLILAQQQIMDSGPETYHRCPYCVKAFLNGSFLQAHLEKRHSERYIRSMYNIENKKEVSPHREQKQNFHSSSEKRIEELIREFATQNKSSGNKSDEIERMRLMMEDMMRQQRDEMDDVVNDLQRRLDEANRRSMKTSSHLGDLVDDKDDSLSQKAGEQAIRKALNERQSKKKVPKQVENKLEKPIVKKRQKGEPLQSNHEIQAYSSQAIQAYSSPKSPIRRTSTEIIPQPVSQRNSVESIGKITESLNFDHKWENNVDYRAQAREEVLNMLAEHLEHHGIQRNAPGISNPILRDKLDITGKEQKQLSNKYVDFADIRQKIVTVVEKLARKQMEEKENQKKPVVQHSMLKEPQGSSTIIKAPSPQKSVPQAKVPSPPLRKSVIENEKRDLVISSESDWDEKSVRKDHMKQEKEALRKNKLEYEHELEGMLRSPRKQAEMFHNARKSSDLSNSLDSSLWGPSESKAVTSVAPPGNTHKSLLTNKSSDMGNHTDSFTET